MTCVLDRLTFLQQLLVSYRMPSSLQHSNQHLESVSPSQQAQGVQLFCAKGPFMAVGPEQLLSNMLAVRSQMVACPTPKRLQV